MNTKELYEEQKTAITSLQEFISTHTMCKRVKELIESYKEGNLDELDFMMEIHRLINFDRHTWERLNGLKLALDCLVRSQQKLLIEINEETERRQGLENFLEGR